MRISAFAMPCTRCSATVFACHVMGSDSCQNTMYYFNQGQNTCKYIAIHLFTQFPAGTGYRQPVQLGSCITTALQQQRHIAEAMGRTWPKRVGERFRHVRNSEHILHVKHLTHPAVPNHTQSQHIILSRGWVLYCSHIAASYGSLQVDQRDIAMHQKE